MGLDTACSFPGLLLRRRADYELGMAIASWPVPLAEPRPLPCGHDHDHDHDACVRTVHQHDRTASHRRPLSVRNARLGGCAAVAGARRRPQPADRRAHP